MAIKSCILKRVVTAFAFLALFVAPLHADDVEQQLLEQLRVAPESEAARLDRELSLIWARSGSAAMDLLLKRGRDAMEAEDTGKAIDHLTALTDHAPDFAEGWHARATAFYQAGLYGPALDDLERALALNPHNYNAIFGLGVMFQEFGDLERAAEAFGRVLALHPHHENAKTAMEQLKRSGIGRTL
ncbi:tetratricopeptide repeat protein [Roseobacter sp. YSTF-M11]|uniref:Tetratricopeptide repeat protein n=1 Tax=Roseobacter insulae TaxID=2859783 RepID=A0A9X1FTW8_9RHOB|nr:tetratricopeptide repeat protein [Roseobacter insulae]MBW4707780.1 tetratricopeptide repeat protein [Roseobacter insulae]